MLTKVCIIIAINCLVATVQGSPTPVISYIQDLKVSYENGLWVCGDIECPTDTFGCRIQRKTDNFDGKILNVVYTCFDENKTNIVSATNSIEMAKERTIDIDVESSVGAVSVYSVGYGFGGNEHAGGVVSPNDWDEFIESAKQNMKSVEDSNAPFE